MDEGYTIQLARPEHLSALPEIEAGAAELFAGHRVPESVMSDRNGPAEFREIQQQGRLWVALAPDGQPAGFAMIEPLGHDCHLEELDVAPDHGRRGVGSALVLAVCEWARQHGHAAMTLTTYRDVPFNAPLYARLGFRELPRADWSREIVERVQQEAARDLDPERRLVMCARFDPCMIRPARHSEVGLLSELAVRSKAHWGYSREFMDQCRGELTLSSDYLNAHICFVVEDDGDVAGFGTLEHLSASRVELGHLFVDPARIGHGYGRVLMEHIVEVARIRGYHAIEIQADPNVEKFYVSAGAARIGTKASSSIPGRELPLMELDLRT